MFLLLSGGTFAVPVRNGNYGPVCGSFRQPFTGVDAVGNLTSIKLSGLQRPQMPGKRVGIERVCEEENDLG